MATRSLTPGAEGIAGKLGGSVLAAIRSGVGMTQESLAELVRQAPSTVQAWESGRRPLARQSVQDQQRLLRHLRHQGASPALINVLVQAVFVDSIYTDMLAQEGDPHPLSLVVPDRTTTELLAWPLTGVVPRELRTAAPRLHVPAGVRSSVARELRQAADAVPSNDRGAMMRRQVKFLVAHDEESRGWVAEQVRSETRVGVDLRSWTPAWAVARSQAVASSHQGDLEPLRRFIAQALSNEQGIEANLNYWAYWVGESPEVWTEDSDMTHGRSDWLGDRLLESLLDGVAHAPYRELCIHALWSLLRWRRHLAGPAATKHRIGEAARLGMESDQLSPEARSRLEQVLYLAESG
ncbi:helix-turn-helix domain-containing protein [Pseudonocardia sp. HH130630-07]|uniref:helix-turn-helix domain-containing protein n=1 Tax=Pseudonocardia sp. HH130630-07 TaxID=1690815 RepID=UPI0008152068|nr:helix-turn-helix transcriptional regulator [Pseudonocardia sp. HH130630-07]ANY10621.1 hypothetical protein AFB00_29895 [Pseudonocardia sp. HH130630-07]